MAARAPKRYHATPSSSKLRARSASSSAMGEGIGDVVEPLAKSHVSSEIQRTCRGVGVIGTGMPHLEEKSIDCIPGRPPPFMLEPLGPVGHFGRRNGIPVPRYVCTDAVR